MKRLIDSDRNQVTKVFSTTFLEFGGNLYACLFKSLFRMKLLETQGKLFDYIASTYPEMDTEDFIVSYMTSKTREYIDEGQAYVCTMSVKDLWQYFKLS